MVPLSLSVEFCPRDEPCLAITQCDADEFYIWCDFSYPEWVTEPANLSEAIDQSYGTHRSSYVIFIGEADTAFESYFDRMPFRIIDTSIYESPKIWVPVKLDPVPDSLPSEFIVYDLVPDDHHDRIDTWMSICYDLARKEVAFRFDGGGPVDKWHRIADTVAVGEDPKHELAEIRFEAVTGLHQISSAIEALNTGRTARLKRWIQKLQIHS